MKKYWIYIAIIILLLVVLISTDKGKPREIDWSAYYTSAHKEPLGTYAFYHLLPQVFPGKQVIFENTSLYTFLDGLQDSGKNLIIINSYISFDKEQAKRLLDFVGAGNNVFIASKGISGIEDTVGFRLNNTNTGLDSIRTVLTDASDSNYYYPESDLSSYIDSVDKKNISVLGQLYFEADSAYPNFITSKWGYGNIYICMNPYAFSNNALLHTANARYAYSAISHLPVADTYWFENFAPVAGEDTPLMYILSQPSLKWGYYLLLLSVLIYIFFEGKRRQKIIPIIKPLSNATVEFVETVGRLYYHTADHKNLAEKKISHFYEFLRKKLFVRTDKIDDDLIAKLQSKTGFDVAFLKKLFNSIVVIQNSGDVSAEQLIAMNQQIDKFYKKYNP
jgi:hypothetical protein